jgi:hypothetical protein
MTTTPRRGQSFHAGFFCNLESSIDSTILSVRPRWQKREMKVPEEIKMPVTLDRILPYVWSIGIYAGDSPFKLTPARDISNPVLSASEVSDVVAAFVADPFMIRVNENWHMFFEVFNSETFNGEIGLATSEDGRRWRYQQIVLREPFHLSYPYVFEWQGDYYMVPETLAPKSIQLYKASAFPNEWLLESSLIAGEFADPSLFHFRDRWWLFACSTPHEHDTLRLFFADQLTGPWQEHPASPIVQGNNRIARPGGRVVVLDDTVIRYAQDCFPMYGSQVRAFEVFDLTPTSYHERELESSPVLTASGAGWNSSGMHHVDPHQTRAGNWIACVDGLCINLPTPAQPGDE